MNKILVIFIVALTICGHYSLASSQEPASGGIDRLLPQGSDLNGWTPDGPPQLAYGEDLYLLINGGAEIYIEHGFKSAALAVYKHKSGRTADVEIFEMATPAAAQEVYKYKTGGAKDNAAIGQEARVEDYYLHFRYKRFLITLTGSDSGEEAIKELTALAHLVEKRMQED